MKAFSLISAGFVFMSFSAQSFADTHLGDECIGRSVLKAFYIQNSSANETVTFTAWRSFGGDLPEQEEHKRDIQEVTQLPLKLLGSGIRSQKTGESIAFACVGAPIEGALEPQCDCVRSVYYNPQSKKVYSFGGTRRLYDIQKQPNFEITENYLKKYIRAEMKSMDQVDDNGSVYHNRTLQSVFNNAAKFSVTDGWSWSSNPVAVSDKRFLKVTNALAGGMVLAPEHTLQYMKSQGPDSWDSRILLNQYMVRELMNHTGHWID